MSRISKHNVIRHSFGTNLATVMIYAFITLFALVCVVPFILVVIVSFSSEKSISLIGYSFKPIGWSTGAYKLLLNRASGVPKAYLITISVTVIGTVLASLITFGAGYALANRNCKYRNGLSLYFYITMVFSAGLVPWYMVSKKLGMYDNIWALIVPSMIFSPFNMFLVRNFAAGIPEELDDAAKIDGAGDITTAFKVYFPLCKPVMATIALFYAIGYWNNYFNAVMLINDPDFYNLQMLLFKIQSQVSALSKLSFTISATSNPPKESFKMAMSVVTMGPIVLLYPFLQKYFVKGMVVGAVKG